MNIDQKKPRMSIGKEYLLNKRTFMGVILTIFILSVLVLYAIFMVFDVTGKNSKWVKYASILVCLGMAWVYVDRPKTDGLLVGVALAFTAIADYFLLLRTNLFEVGIVAFIIVQMFYLVRLYCLNGAMKRIWITIIIRVVMAGIVCGILAGTGVINWLNVLACLYFINLVATTVETALYAYFHNYRAWIFVIGLGLLCCCDVCVGLNNVNVMDSVQNLASFAMWAFYLPSQVLIVLSKFVLGVSSQRIET